MLHCTRTRLARFALLAPLAMAGCGGGDLFVTKRRVFVTRSAYTGKMGDLVMADTVCANTATAAGLPGVFFAWLTDGSINALERMKDGDPWYPVGAESGPVFRNRAGLTTQPEFPIRVDEFGAAVDKPRYWTGARTGGLPADACDGWTSEDPAKRGYTGDGAAGISWTEAAAEPCDARRALLCLQQ